MDNLDKHALEQAQATLEKYAEVLREKKIDSRMYIQTGVDDAKVAICQVTVNEDCDILVLGNRGFSGVKK